MSHRKFCSHLAIDSSDSDAVTSSLKLLQPQSQSSLPKHSPISLLLPHISLCNIFLTVLALPLPDPFTSHWLSSQGWLFPSLRAQLGADWAALGMAAAGFTGTSVNIYRTVWRHTLEDCSVLKITIAITTRSTWAAAVNYVTAICRNPHNSTNLDYRLSRLYDYRHTICRNVPTKIAFPCILVKSNIIKLLEPEFYI